MTKELSIEKIKKELIDNISNNSEILEYFENYLQGEEYHKHCLKEYGMKYIKDNFIFANDMSMSDNCNFISVEVNEEEGTNLKLADITNIEAAQEWIDDFLGKYSKPQA